MSRMPANVLYSFRYAFRALVFIAAVATFSAFSPIAHADPHAVFYTDRAQEQVFFNTLAALNQADFVEPGLADGTGRTRQELINKRTQAVPSPNPQNAIRFVTEQNPVINSTHTDLPGVVSRNITLEGNDLWTAYLVQQFALETTTRRSESQLARIFCERGLGKIGCNSTIGANAQLEEKSFTTTPFSENGELIASVGSALSSGKKENTDLKTEIRNSSDKIPVFTIPRPYVPGLGSLNENIAKLPGAQTLVDSLAQNITTGDGVDPGIFNDVTFDEEGIPHLKKDIPPNERAKKLSQLAALPKQLIAAAQDAKNQALDAKRYIQNPTTKADYILKSENPDGTGSLYPQIEVPASAKLAQIDAAAQLLADSATSQKLTNPRSIAQAGNQSLVDPTQQSITEPGQADLVNQRLLNQIQGLSRADQSTQGQVAGISTLDPQISELYRKNYFGAQSTTLSPSVFDESVLSEPGILDLREAFGDTSQKLDALSVSSSSAFSIDLKNLLNGAQATMDNIICSWFPSIERCLSNTNSQTSNNLNPAP